MDVNGVYKPHNRGGNPPFAPKTGELGTTIRFFRSSDIKIQCRDGIRNMNLPCIYIYVYVYIYPYKNNHPKK